MALIGWWAKTAYVEYAGAFSSIESYIIGFFAMVGLAIIIALLTKRKRGNFKNDHT